MVHGLSHFCLPAILFLLLPSLAASSFCYRSFSRSEFPSCQDLSPGVYALHWRVNNGTITFAVDVQVGSGSTAWVGLGLSEVGGMIGADFMVVHQNISGDWTVGDFWSEAFDTPIPDQQQDVHLVGRPLLTDGRMLAVFSRKLSTCDTQDRPVNQGDEQHVIWAYQVSPCRGPRCPPAWPNAPHSTTTRGSTVVNFVPRPATGPRPDLSDLRRLDLRMPPTPVPATPTTYMCRNFLMPSDSKYHVTGYEALLDPATTPYVHHMILFGCRNDTKLEESDETYECSSMSGLSCLVMLMGWAPGARPSTLPAEAGIPLGAGAGSWTSLVLQVHYNNPLRVAGLTDSSGMLIYITRNLRPNDLGVMILGSLDILLPANRSNVALQPNTCGSFCTQRFDGPVTLVTNHFHMHYLGSTISTRHFRNNTELEPLGTINHWQFNFQGPTPVAGGPRPLLPGDSLVTSCSYNTLGQQRNVTWGEASDSEMCFNFLAYYPAQPNINICMDVRYSTRNWQLCADVGSLINAGPRSFATTLPTAIRNRWIMMGAPLPVPPPAPKNCTRS